IDMLEYQSPGKGHYVMYLRMPGQLWDPDAISTSNSQRWYRREDGRFLSPDPIGLEGGEPGYFAYVNSNPLNAIDPSGNYDLCCACGNSNCGLQGRDACVYYYNCPGHMCNAQAVCDCKMACTIQNDSCDPCNCESHCGDPVPMG